MQISLKPSACRQVAPHLFFLPYHYSHPHNQPPSLASPPMPSAKLLLAATLAVAVHSFDAVLAQDAPQITPAPTPTTPERRQVAGASGTPILSTLHYAYTDLPYQVYPFQVLRGPQFGFNQCNSTTLGDSSNCQTLVFNGPVSGVLFLMRVSLLQCHVNAMFGGSLDTARLKRTHADCWLSSIGRLLPLGIP
jgi:hypothetical protein